MNEPNKAEMVESILKLADRLFRKLLPTVPREIIEFDITMPQLKILFILFISGATRMSALASDLGVTMATASGLVDRLVEREMVARDSEPTDRRVVLCRLSEEGQKVVSRIWESARNNMRNMLAALEVSELQKMASVLKTLLNTAERASQSA